MNFVEELRWRGMLQDIMPGTEECQTQGVDFPKQWLGICQEEAKT